MNSKRYKNSDYFIYEDGRCYSCKSNKFLSPQMSVEYPTYNLTLDGKKKKVKIHRMVAETFLEQPNPEYNIVNHLDGDTHNYNINNLEWVNNSQNSKHAYENGLMTSGNQKINKYICNLDNEEWAQIKDYPLYLVSSKGRVMNIRTKRLLKAAISNNGYYTVNLWKQNKGTTIQIHQLVYSNFNKDYDLKGMVINHIDGNKLNNDINNLEKTSYKINNLHAEYIINTHNCKKSVNQLDNNKNIINSFASIAEATRQTHINNISRAVKTKQKAGGFYWEFN